VGVITFKLKRKHWDFVSTLGIDNGDIVHVSYAKQYVKEKFNGEFEMSRGFGSITFQTEKELNWFLLHV
jgi:hypothetical protein